MVGPVRPSLDVDGTLDDDEWLELYRESLRVGWFWPRLAAVTCLLMITVGLTRLIGVPVSWTLGGMATMLGMSATYATGYAWLGPWRWRQRLTSADRTARWRISAVRLWTDAAGEELDLAWCDIDRVRVTRRLVIFKLTGDRGLRALPRRTASELGEALVRGWAAGENTPVSGGR